LVASWSHGLMLADDTFDDAATEVELRQLAGANLGARDAAMPTAWPSRPVSPGVCSSNC